MLVDIEARRMRSILVLKIFLVFVTVSSCENLIRRKRFLSALWPSSAPKNDKNNVVYVHLPVEYIEMMHKELQNRADHPQKDKNLKPEVMPKIIMKPILPRPEVHIQELPLPEIHTTHRFVTPTPFPKTVTQKPEVPLYNEQQSLPIKRVSENSIAKPSIVTADISDFYHTQEFSDLLNEFKIKVDVKKLPDIQDVMIILGTEDAEDTLRTIREVANTPEGMELITSYLKGNSDQEAQEDRYYNIYDDVGAGEIRVSDEDFNKAYIQQFGNEILQSDDASQYNYAPVENPATATPAPLSWWQKPLSWLGFYGDVKSTKVEQLKTDAEILGKAIHDPEGLGRFGYTRKFLNPLGHRKKVPIEPPLKISGIEESRLISSEPYEAPSTLPPIQMTEEDFDRMVKELRLSPVNPPPPVTTTTTSTTPQPPVTTFEPIETDDELPYEPPTINDETQTFELPINVAETFEIDIPDPQIPHKVILNSEPFETTRRSYESVSGPVRHSPIESRTGKVFRVNPEEVLKESKSIAADFEGKEINF